MITEKEIEQKFLDILFQSSNKLELENELEKNGFDKRLSEELLRGCKMTACRESNRRESDIIFAKSIENEKYFVKLFLDFINDKIDTDFSDIQFGNENGEIREERLNNYAKWIYKCQKSTFTYKETTVSLYVRKKELFIGSTFDRRLKNRKTYDISDIINVIENRKTNG